MIPGFNFYLFVLRCNTVLFLCNTYLTEHLYFSDNLNFFFDMLSETDVLTGEQFDLMNETEDFFCDFVKEVLETKNLNLK